MTEEEFKQQSESETTETFEEVEVESIENITQTEDNESCEVEVKDFPSLGLDARLTRALSLLHIEKPTLIQSKAIPIALTGRDFLARAPTGSGKTLSYVLPLLEKILTFEGENNNNNNSAVLQVQAIILVPTKELALQVTGVIDKISRYCSKEMVRFYNLAQEDSLSLQQSSLIATRANLLISTPSRLLPHLSSGLIKLTGGIFQNLVLDEADLILSFGFQSDLDAIVPHLPKLFQTMLLSATLSDDLDSLKALLLHSPVIIKIDDEPAGGADGANSNLKSGRTLKQYSISAVGDEKFLFTYVTLKLNLLRGKILIFCNSTDRAYKLKLFLDQFGVKTGVLNPELPLMSRHGIVDQFNRSVFDILIASDEVGTSSSSVKSTKKKEGGVARGVDFKRVDVVLNFDFPESLDAYTHRVGRTARGSDGRGTAVTLVDNENDSEVIIQMVRDAVKLQDFPFPLNQLEAFRYRCLDALRATTKSAVKRARATELSKQILASQKLATTFFTDRPKDLQLLRNDSAIAGRSMRIQQHMKHVPEYLLQSVGVKVKKQSKTLDIEEGAEESYGKNNEAGSSSTSNGLFNVNAAKNGKSRFMSESKSTDTNKNNNKRVKTKNEAQVIQAPEHLKLPQTVLAAAATNPSNNNSSGSRYNRNGNNKYTARNGKGGGKKNDPLKSGKLYK